VIVVGVGNIDAASVSAKEVPIATQIAIIRAHRTSVQFNKGESVSSTILFSQKNIKEQLYHLQ
jgi:hypothetical protein